MVNLVAACPHSVTVQTPVCPRSMFNTTQTQSYCILTPLICLQQTSAAEESHWTELGLERVVQRRITGHFFGRIKDDSGTSSKRTL